MAKLDHEGNVTFEDILNYPYWRHRVPLGDGEVTPGLKSRTVWEALNLPEDLSGKSVLDISAWDGLFSFEAERRGAEEVLAIDVWEHPTIDAEHWESLRPGKQGFDLIHNYLNSDVDSQILDVYDLSPDAVGTFDIVLCPGLIYHLPHPLLAIEKAVSVAEELVVVESSISGHGGGDGPPTMEFYQPDPSEYGVSNPSRWWSPSLHCLEKMVQTAGCDNTTAFVPDDSDNVDPILPTTSAYIPSGTTVYQEFTLESSIDRTRSRSFVTVLYQTDDAARIQLARGEQDDHEQIQGWISASELSEYDEDADIPARLVKTARNEGLRSTVGKIGWKVSELLSADTPNRGVVHGYVTSSTAAD